MSIGISLFLGREFPIFTFLKKGKKIVVMVVGSRLTFLFSVSSSDNELCFPLSLVVRLGTSSFYSTTWKTCS
jgi:hypothetical protein